jgi:plastocyanin
MLMVRPDLTRILLGLLLIIALAACGEPPAERRLDLTVAADGYREAQLEATVGEQLFITLRNEDSVAHSLTVDLPSGSRTVSAEDGVDAILALTLREPGAFRMYCVVPGHSEEATLVVRPAPGDR